MSVIFTSVAISLSSATISAGFMSALHLYNKKESQGASIDDIVKSTLMSAFSGAIVGLGVGVYYDNSDSREQNFPKPEIYQACFDGIPSDKDMARFTIDSEGRTGCRYMRIIPK